MAGCVKPAAFLSLLLGLMLLCVTAANELAVERSVPGGERKGEVLGAPPKHHLSKREVTCPFFLVDEPPRSLLCNPLPSNTLSLSCQFLVGNVFFLQLPLSMGWFYSADGITGELVHVAEFTAVGPFSSFESVLVVTNAQAGAYFCSIAVANAIYDSSVLRISQETIQHQCASGELFTTGPSVPRCALRNLPSAEATIANTTSITSSVDLQDTVTINDTVAEFNVTMEVPEEEEESEEPVTTQSAVQGTRSGVLSIGVSVGVAVIVILTLAVVVLALLMGMLIYRRMRGSKERSYDGGTSYNRQTGALTYTPSTTPLLAYSPSDEPPPPSEPPPSKPPPSKPPPVAERTGPFQVQRSSENKLFSQLALPSSEGQRPHHTVGASRRGRIGVVRKKRSVTSAAGSHRPKTAYYYDSHYYSRPQFRRQGRSFSTSTHIYGELGSGSEEGLYISTQDIGTYYRPMLVKDITEEELMLEEDLEEGESNAGEEYEEEYEDEYEEKEEESEKEFSSYKDELKYWLQKGESFTTGQTSADQHSGDHHRQPIYVNYTRELPQDEEDKIVSTTQVSGQASARPSSDHHHHHHQPIYVNYTRELPQVEGEELVSTSPAEATASPNSRLLDKKSMHHGTRKKRIQKGSRVQRGGEDNYTALTHDTLNYTSLYTYIHNKDHSASNGPGDSVKSPQSQNSISNSPGFSVKSSKRPGYSIKSQNSTSSRPGYSIKSQNSTSSRPGYSIKSLKKNSSAFNVLSEKEETED